MENIALPLPIPRDALEVAETFARQQPTVDKANQVRLNTLAVCVVNNYLQLMGIDTDFSTIDSWNPVVRFCADVADLDVVGVGRLECRPLAADLRSADFTCSIPAEVLQDRIGYVVVQINEATQQANILGFAKTVTAEELSLRELRSPEALLQHLDDLKQAAAISNSVSSETNALVRLNQWLQNRFETGWQTVESLLIASEPNPAFAFRSSSDSAPDPSITIRRARLIDLGIQLTDRPIALIVELTPESPQRIAIRLQVHPTEPTNYLPPDLHLTVLDDTGATFLEAQSRSADNYIQLQFNGSPGEQFSVRVALGLANIVENFVI
jgi:hypothetical protein